MFPKDKVCFAKHQDSASRRHPPPPIDEFAEDLAAGLAEKFSNDAAKLGALVRHRNELDPTVRQLLIEVLQVSAEHITEFADQLAKDFDPLAPLKIVEVVDLRCAVREKGCPHEDH